MAAALKYGVALAVGVDHASYKHEVSVENQTRAALVNDLT